MAAMIRDVLVYLSRDYTIGKLTLLIAPDHFGGLSYEWVSILFFDVHRIKTILQNVVNVWLRFIERYVGVTQQTGNVHFGAYF